FSDTEKQVTRLAETGDPAVVAALEALSDGDLYVRKSDGLVTIGKRAGGAYALRDPLTGEELGALSSGALDKIRVNNRLRRSIRAALGGLTLRAADPAIRGQAAEAVFKAGDADAIPALDAAIAAETDPSVARQMREARAAAILGSALPLDDRLAAIETLAERGDRDA
ncbi:unnamed protein product, partial [Scytosiphon promiscuus]